MRKTVIAVAFLPLLCASLPAAAAGFMKQGLWEMTIKSDQMKAMPKLSPEQMEMMRQRGIQMPQMSDGGMVTKMCVSKEMAERDSPPSSFAGASGQSECKPQNQQRSGSTYSSDMVCTGPTMQGKGSTKVSFTGDSFNSVTDFKGTSHGTPVNSHSETSGKYLGADCGTVKPYAMPAK
ncbi:MAG: hypothetical protein JWN73_1794 [Betaproteobacteria bacterium]|nr:hypothetical protein [Betaproteobacteria bacterium]